MVATLSLSVHVRFSTTDPPSSPPFSASTMKKPSRSNWNRSPGLAPASGGDPSAPRTIYSEAGSTSSSHEFLSPPSGTGRLPGDSDLNRGP